MAVGPPAPIRRRRRILLTFLTALVLWAAAAATLVLTAAADLREAKTRVTALRDDLEPESIQDGTLARGLSDSATRFRRGHDRLRHPLLLPIRVVPVVGRQHRSAIALAGGAAEVAAAGSEAAARVADAVDPTPTEGGARIAALRAIGTASRRAADRLGRVRLGTDEGLVAPLADARAELAEEIDEANRVLVRGAALTRALTAFLDTPRKYVLVAANNAEMRAGSGMFLSIGLLETGGGKLGLGEMRPAGDLQVEPPGVPVTGDLAELWGWADPGRDWRSLALSPRFEASAPLAADLWQAHLGMEVDGVLAVDVVTLQALLRATGPVDVGDETIAAEGVGRRLLHDQYEGITFDEARGGDQDQRREELGSIADAVVDAIEGGRADLPSLAQELSRAAAGRHLLAWSRHPEEQAGWEAADISGKLADDSVVVSVLNRGGNKLDPFLDVEADLRWTAPSRGRRSLELTVRIENETPEDEPEYVAGPHPAHDVEAGTYLGLIGLNLPGAAADLTAEGAAVVVRGADGPTQALALELELPRGARTEAVVRFTLPDEIDRLSVEPGARIPATEFRAAGRTWTDERRTLVDLGL